jgi:hypothetical protein
MSRRGFIGSILALGAAPAIVRADSLMRVYVPRGPTVLRLEPRPVLFSEFYGIQTPERDAVRRAAQSVFRIVASEPEFLQGFQALGIAAVRDGFVVGEVAR